MNAVAVWQPTEQLIQQSNLLAFMQYCQQRFNIDLATYDDLYQWSITDFEAFWQAFYDDSGIVAEGQCQAVYSKGATPIDGAWFSGIRLNFAENLLKYAHHNPDDVAIYFQAESVVEKTLIWGALVAQVSQVQQRLRAQGFSKGDCAAGVIGNCPEAVVAMLAVTSLGGIWTACSPDFGEAAILERFSQTQPKILFAHNGYYYNQKQIDCRAKIQNIAAKIAALKHTIWVTLVPLELPDGLSYEAITQSTEVRPLRFDKVAFNDPVYIMYSSGTTGAPKCIVHGAGNVLIQHLKEHRLHCDIKPKDRVFYFTTCAWMMWHWQISALGSGASIVLYEGFPLVHRPSILFEYAQRVGVTHFGTSAKYINTLAKDKVNIKDSQPLECLRQILVTGSPSSVADFEYVYSHIKSSVHLASICGGTDILSCFILGCPILPVFPGEIQVRGLGMAVQVFDDDGRPLVQQKGELVCTQPFPSMPIYFWGQSGREQYLSAYFKKFEGVWTHGDYIELTNHQGVIVYGRSDTVLNPQGVRIGSAEIYQQVDQFDEITESVVVAHEQDQDVRIILFVVMANNHALDSQLKQAIQQKICQSCSPRHVPSVIYAVPDVPKTRNGKLSEIAVKSVIHGESVKNINALLNPECLKHFVL